MNSQQALSFLVEHGEPLDYSAAVVADARMEGQANLARWEAAA